MKRVSVFFADGCEEIEALTVVDILRRAEVHVDMISVTGKREITGSHHIKIQTEKRYDEMEFGNTDMLVLPGGMPGTLYLQEHKSLCGLLQEYDKEEKYVAAICAAPSVLGGLGILKGRKACSYPGFEDRLEGAEVVTEPVVQDGHVITGRGMGAAIPFALKLTEVLCGRERAEEVKAAILF